MGKFIIHFSISCEYAVLFSFPTIVLAASSVWSMLPKFICTTLLLFTLQCFSQKGDTGNAFIALKPYTYGIPIQQKFFTWEKYIKNNDDYTYINRDYKELGVVFSNLITLKNYTTYGNTIDSVLFILQHQVYKDEATNQKDTADYLQVYMVFKKSGAKKIIDSVFKQMEGVINIHFDEENINKNKYNNGTKIMYSLKPMDYAYPITIEKYYDEEIKRYVISLFINKRREYTNPLQVRAK